MFDIEKFLDLSGYELNRNKRRKNTNWNNIKNSMRSAEFFTPYSIVKKMSDKISETDWSDPNKTFCEPSFGNGQFVCYIIWNRIQHGIDWKTALETCYGVELMQDNVAETKQRVHELLRNISPDYDPQIADEIMDKNFVCSDFFKWNFEEWRPMTEDEIQASQKKKKKVKSKKIQQDLFANVKFPRVNKKKKIQHKKRKKIIKDNSTQLMLEF